MTARLASLLALVSLAACGSGVVRAGPDNGAGTPVAPSPGPSPASQPPVANPAPPAAPEPQRPEPPTTEPYQGYGEGSPVEIRRIGRWIGSGISGERRLVIRDDATFSRFWAELGAGVKPQVDFSRDLVVAVAAGRRPTGGYDIAVSQVTRSGGELRIGVIETTPGAGCATTQALTQPVDVVLVDGRGVTGWGFADSTVATPCR